MDQDISLTNDISPGNFRVRFSKIFRNTICRLADNFHISFNSVSEHSIRLKIMKCAVGNKFRYSLSRVQHVP